MFFPLFIGFQHHPMWLGMGFQPSTVVPLQPPQLNQKTHTKNPPPIPSIMIHHHFSTDPSKTIRKHDTKPKECVKCLGEKNLKSLDIQAILQSYLVNKFLEPLKSLKVRRCLVGGLKHTSILMRYDWMV